MAQIPELMLSNAPKNLDHSARLFHFLRWDRLGITERDQIILGFDLPGDIRPSDDRYRAAYRRYRGLTDNVANPRESFVRIPKA